MGERFVVFRLSVRKCSIATGLDGRDAAGIVGECSEFAVCDIEWIWRVCSLVCSLVGLAAIVCGRQIV